MTRNMMPPEWAPHERTWMSWLCAQLTYGDTLPQARQGHCQIKLFCYDELRIWAGFENRCLAICQAIQRILPNM